MTKDQLISLYTDHVDNTQSVLEDYQRLWVSNKVLSTHQLALRIYKDVLDNLKHLKKAQEYRNSKIQELLNQVDNYL